MGVLPSTGTEKESDRPDSETAAKRTVKNGDEDEVRIEGEESGHLLGTGAGIPFGLYPVG